MILFNLVVPSCGDFVDCVSCAVNDQCAWCASDNICTTIADAFTKDCRGLVFDPPCPSSYVSGMNFLERKYEVFLRKITKSIIYYFVQIT